MIPTTVPKTTSAPPTAIGDRIREAREACGLSQGELAGLIGLTTRSAVSYYESGQRDVSAETIWKIAHVTRKPVSFFFQA